ncbi:MAG: pyridoxal phosphate-dependent aminotransferase [Bradymonadaceae bacterium]|nr:pyridoxal phosphate-dependent aminotransferase [Lujinxingiaceae bacterium]
MTRNYRSDRIGNLQQSEIRAMTRECVRLGGLNLGQGICPLPSPPEILEAASEAILADKSTYSKFEGVDDLRTTIAKKMASYNKLEVNADTDVIVTIGSTGSFVCTLQGLFNPGDEIIIFEPFYGYHVNALRVSGCEANFVTLTPPDWSFTREAIEAAITPKTRGILVNTPGNPSGKVFSRAELETIASICQEHDLIAITDEIYEYLVYDGHVHTSLATLPGMWERTVTMSGFSKTFAITGWRLGYTVAPAHLATPIGFINDLFYICAPTPLQYGLAAGMARLSPDYYTEMSDRYRQKRDYFCDALISAGLTPHIPQGAYYILADVSHLGFSDDKKAAMHILETTGVASVPGSSFFASDTGRSLTRFCVAQEWEVVKEAAERIATL